MICSRISPAHARRNEPSGLRDKKTRGGVGVFSTQLTPREAFWNAVDCRAGQRPSDSHFIQDMTKAENILPLQCGNLPQGWGPCEWRPSVNIKNCTRKKLRELLQCDAMRPTFFCDVIKGRFSGINPGKRRMDEKARNG